MSTVLYSQTEDETRGFGEILARILVPNGIALLFGDLGSGKTVFTQGLARGLGIDPKEVQSPTFTLVREHHGKRFDLVHIDLYRLESADLDALGLWDLLGGSGVKAVEWPERLPYPVDETIRVFFEVEESGGGRRALRIETDKHQDELREILNSLSMG